MAGNVVVENLTVNPTNETRSQSGLGSVTDFLAAGLAIESKARAGTMVTAVSGAEMESHDNERGVLRIRPTGDGQVVAADLGRR